MRGIPLLGFVLSPGPALAVAAAGVLGELASPGIVNAIAGCASLTATAVLWCHLAPGLRAPGLNGAENRLPAALESCRPCRSRRSHHGREA
jgi:hypothetical protein